MSTRKRAVALALATIALPLGVVGASAPTSKPKGPTMTAIARGTFEVKITPHPLADPVEGSNLGRMAIDKQFHGDLEGVGKGEMLTAMTAVKGSAGYVAIERVKGKLAGRSGSFALQHSGTMNRGTPTLSITVVPDSGTEGLAGLSGKLDIEVDGGNHSYEFEYTLPDAP